MIRRLVAPLAVALTALCFLAPAASAAAPSVGAVSATDIQGVSALLVGTVNPQGLPTTYQFEYASNSGLAGAATTAARSAGSGSSPEDARAAIAGLTPSTTYYYRLVATNSSGTTTGSTGSFQTTAGFGLLSGEEGFSAGVYADGGEPATESGTHPYQLSFNVGFRTGGEYEGQPGATFPDGDVRDLRIEMPTGLILNPSVTPVCTRAEFSSPRMSPYEVSRSGENCPVASQVGTVSVSTSEGERTFGLFNLEPAPGTLAQLGFSSFGAPVVIDTQLQANGDGSYSLRLEANNMPQALDLSGFKLNLWGTPWGASHNGERGNCLNEREPTFPWAKCSVGDPKDFEPAAYLSLQSMCTGPLSFNLTVDSWQQPGDRHAAAVNRNEFGEPADMTCSFLEFEPEMTGHLDSTKATSPSGYVFRLNVEHARLTNPAFTNPAPPRTVIVKLPDGTTVNPSVGAGLGVCARAEFAAETAESTQGQGCPAASKIGTLRVKTPLFSDQLSGDIYLAQPDDPSTTAPGAENPFDSLVAIYLLAKAPERAVMVKLAGQLRLDPQSGTVTAVFDGLPQLPYTDLEASFRSGQRSFLATPDRCGYVGSSLEALPWGEAETVQEESYTLIKTGAGGGDCPSGRPPFEPAVVSGAVNSNVNAFTPYFVRITRKDTEQELTSYSLVLPQGVTGKLAGVAKCPDSAIAAARTRRGAEESAHPSCPAESLVGHTLVGYGVGSALTYAEGNVYLAGPYHGAPLSLVTVNPATIGPFDLGTVVIQSAFQVDQRTAQLRIDSSASDPIPHIIDGIVLHLKDVRVHIDRPEFTHNPSSCAASELTSNLTGSGADFTTSADDSKASPSTYFQLLNCRILGFRPRLGVRLRGGTKRGDYPQLRTTFAARGPNDSNLKEIAVVIPRQEFLAQEHIRTICTKVQFAKEECPKESVYGSAVGYTPLLDEPLRGKLYLRSSSGALPDLVADLHSGTVKIVLEGKIGPGKHGGIRAFFTELPDEPISKFTMTFYGGKRGLLVNSADICERPPVSNVKAIAQNNIGAVFTTKLRGQCKHQKSKHGRHRPKGGHR
jgi:hypothetical protein